MHPDIIYALISADGSEQIRNFSTFAVVNKDLRVSSPTQVHGNLPVHYRRLHSLLSVPQTKNEKGRSSETLVSTC